MCENRNISTNGSYAIFIANLSSSSSSSSYFFLSFCLPSLLILLAIFSFGDAFDQVSQGRIT